MITAVPFVPPQTADGVWDRLIENFEAKIVIFSLLLLFVLTSVAYITPLIQFILLKNYKHVL